MFVYERSESSHVLHQVCPTSKHAFNRRYILTWHVYRQVADLERQLMHAKQELDCLRAMFPTLSNGDAENSHIEPQRALFQEAAPAKFHGIRGQPSDDSSDVILQMQLHGRGLFSSSKRSSSHEPVSWPAHDVPELPPLHTADYLLESYHTQFHPLLPIIDWPNFISEYEEVYRIGNLRKSPRGWITKFFAVLACGSLHATGEDSASLSKKYVQVCTGLLDSCADEIYPDHIRTTFLVSVFLFEINRKTAGWVWLSASKAYAGELKLSGDPNNASAEIATRTNIMAVMSTYERFVDLLKGPGG